ncbi:hypothetical protein [Aliiglaciecola sp. LCG003]|uniref:hypothetical protein n=1 Tax=Aliiglaciecola sp. LCG003 TaxID=3053655 RepID=UPI002572F666|nr:hypothetical protein [Aliiglaciecola sp. LCG003]WJG07897.1 hypothetical protein QR722_11030 [Aliiglaciecola sp. LCG003]
MAKGNENNENQFHLVATAANKAKKEFDKASVIWQIFPEYLFIEALPGDPMQAIVNIENAQHQEYTVLFSGQEKDFDMSLRTTSVDLEIPLSFPLNLIATTVLTYTYADNSNCQDEYPVGSTETFTENWRFDIDTQSVTISYNEPDDSYSVVGAWDPVSNAISVADDDSFGVWEFAVNFDYEASDDYSSPVFIGSGRSTVKHDSAKICEWEWNMRTKGSEVILPE